MGFLSLFSKESKTNYSTTNTFTDQSTNAGDGSIALGQGANLNTTVYNENLSDDVALGSLAAQRDTAVAGLASNQDVSRRAIEANRDVNIESLKTTTDLARSAINTVESIGESASRERVDVLNTTGYALKSQEGIANKLAELAGGALERSQTPDSQVTKQVIWAAVAIAIGLAFLAFRNPRRA